jgi:hypothetical protein
MKTIRDFLVWLKENYAPSIDMEGFDIDAALYKYYNVNVDGLRAEIEDRKNSQ